MWTFLLIAALAHPDTLNPPPEGWTDLRTLPGVRVDARYATADNLSGQPLPGYGAQGAWLLNGPAAALALVASDLAPQGLGLVVFDAYRPKRATDALVAWARRSGQGHLVTQSYISPTSYHNRGMAIDLGLYALDTGVMLDMGSPWDDLSPASHTHNASGDAARHRATLVAAMGRHGWRNYWREWWHFSWPQAGKPPARDVPYACFEAPEGAWSPPVGWDRPGGPAPTAFGVGPCPP